MKKSIINYKGVAIEAITYYTRTYYYPSFNGDIEFTSLKAIKAWIDGPYSFVRKNLDEMGRRTGISGNYLFHIMNNDILIHT